MKISPKKALPAVFLLAAVLIAYWFLSKPSGSAEDRALIEAARAGDAAATTRLLAAGANVNVKLVTPLWTQLKDGEPAAEEGATPLHFAVEGGFQPVVTVLLEKGATVNEQNQYGNTPLMLAAGRLDPKLVSLLLEHGANAAMTNKFGKTASDFATKRNVRPEDRELIKKLQDLSKKKN